MPKSARGCKSEIDDKKDVKCAVKAENKDGDIKLKDEAVGVSRGQQVDEDDFKKLARLKNPKFKKNDALALLPATLRDRLKPIGLELQDQYFTIDQMMREVLVTRAFISGTYGGNMQETFPIPAKKFLDQHNMNDWMFLTTEYQPEAPQLPGAPGLWLNSSPSAPGEENLGTNRVFVKVVPVEGPKTSKYQYLGMYEVQPANPPFLTVQEYRAQTTQFHTTWAIAIVKMGWGSYVCARIFLRRELGREPTYEEVDAILESRGYVSRVSPDDVKGAYMRGEERMGIWTMKCVGYDNAFQRELTEKYPVWVPKLRNKPSKKAAAASAHKTTRTKTRSSNKRKREDTDSETESSALEDSDEDKIQEKVSRPALKALSGRKPVQKKYPKKVAAEHSTADSDSDNSRPQPKVASSRKKGNTRQKTAASKGEGSNTSRSVKKRRQVSPKAGSDSEIEIIEQRRSKRADGRTPKSRQNEVIEISDSDDDMYM